MECVPLCSECSNIYECSTCSFGTLVGGVCLANTVTPSSGVGASTSFSFDASEFASINDHINSELRLSSSSAQISFISGALLYPDSTLHPITDISSFAVPVYQEEGATVFNVEVRLSFRVNGASREAALATLAIS